MWHLPGLCVGIVGRLETKLFNAKLFEELVKHPNQISQGQVSVSYHPLSILTIFESNNLKIHLNLVELRKVGGIQGFIPEDSVD